MGTYDKNHINNVIKTTTFWTDKKEYGLIQLDRKDFANLSRFIAKYKNEYIQIISDRKELTLISLRKTWDENISKEFQTTAEIVPMGIISCNCVEPTVSGYLYTLLSVISPNNIGVYVQSAYTSDHIFVDYKDLEKALYYLNKLKGELI
jgi:hypothetical protein